MANQLLFEFGQTATEIGRAFAPVVASLCGGGVVWKLVDKLIDVSEARRKSREEHEGESSKELRQRLADLDKELRETIRAAAEVPFLQSALTECKKQLDEADAKIDKLEERVSLDEVRHRRELERKAGDLSQIVQNNKILMEFFALMNDAEGQKYLARKRAEKQQ